jgi:GTP cyclohydrolase I
MKNLKDRLDQVLDKNPEDKEFALRQCLFYQSQSPKREELFITPEEVKESMKKILVT